MLTPEDEIAVATVGIERWLSQPRSLARGSYWPLSLSCWGTGATLKRALLQMIETGEVVKTESPDGLLTTLALRRKGRAPR